MSHVKHLTYKRGPNDDGVLATGQSGYAVRILRSSQVKNVAYVFTFVVYGLRSLSKRKKANEREREKFSSLVTIMSVNSHENKIP